MLAPVYELAVQEQATDSGTLVALAYQRRQRIIATLLDCRQMLPPEIAQCVIDMDGYKLVDTILRDESPRVAKVFGVIFGIEGISIQILAPPPFVEPSTGWFVSQDFVASTVHAITISRLINTSVKHPFQNLSQISTIPYLALFASWIHILTLRQLSGQKQQIQTESTGMLVSLINDTNAGMDFIQASASVGYLCLGSFKSAAVSADWPTFPSPCLFQEGWSAMYASFNLLKRSLEEEKLAPVSNEFYRLMELPSSQDMEAAMDGTDESVTSL